MRKILRERKVDSKQCGVIMSIFIKIRNCGISHNIKSEVFIMAEGIRQGNSLSPLLFIAIMNEIIVKEKVYVY